ncbi:MAG: SdrD B-like domain-containing protein, partial [Promethearchaeota archaeon]
DNLGLGDAYDSITDDASVRVIKPFMTFVKWRAGAYDNVPGSTVTFYLDYANTGHGLAHVTIEDTIPAGLTYSGDDSGGSHVAGIVTWIFDVAPQTSGTIELYVTVDLGLTDYAVLTNWATLSYQDDNLGLGDAYDSITDDASVRVIKPFMEFWKEVDLAEVGTGDYLTYTLYYRNTGHATACDVEIVDTLPDGVTFVSSDPPHNSIDGQKITWHVGDVEPSNPGAPEEIIIIVRVNQGTFCHDLINLGILNYYDRNQNSYPTLDDTAQSHTMLETWITDTSLCREVVTDFRIVFTPDIQEITDEFIFKISSTNPGGFYFNILFHAYDSEETINYLIPEDFKSQGAKWIHAFYWDDIYAPYGSPYTYEGCIDWRELENEITDKILEYGSNPIAFEDLVPSSNILITMHLTYALKKSTGYTCDEAKAFNNFGYVFGADVEAHSWHSETILTAHARVKEPKTPLMWGVVQDATLEDTPVAGITFSIYNDKERRVDAFTTDEYGFYLFDNLKPGTYRLEIEIPLDVLLEGLEETDLVLRITIEVKLSKGDYIQVSLYIDGESTTVEGPPGLNPSMSVVDSSESSASSSSSSHPREHSRPFEFPPVADSGYAAEPIVGGFNLGIPIIIAWFASISSLAYVYDMRQRKKQARLELEASIWNNSLEWKFKENPSD